ncbi:hypothetical protein KCV07_g2069, partial [Aureobasidium melanogenum]
LQSAERNQCTAGTTTAVLELVGAVEDPGTLDDEGTTLEEETEILWLDELLTWLDTEFKMDEELKDTARLLVATLTADSEVKSVDDDADEGCDVLPATIPVFKLTMLEVVATDDTTSDDAELDDTGLDAEDAMVEGVTLEVDRRVETEVLLDGVGVVAAKLALGMLKDGTPRLLLLTLDTTELIIEELLLDEDKIATVDETGTMLDTILDDSRLPKIFDVLDDGKSLDDDKMFDNGRLIDVGSKIDDGTMLEDDDTLEDGKILDDDGLSEDGKIEDGKMLADSEMLVNVKSVEVDSKLEDGKMLEDDTTLDVSKMFEVDRTLEMLDDCGLFDADGISKANRLEDGKMLNPNRTLDDCKMLEDGNALKPFVEEDATPVLILIVSTVPEEAASKGESLEMAEAAAGELCRLVDDEGVDVHY